MSNLKSGLFDNLRKLINIVDELRDVGVQDYIRLPRICVLGTQSAGKSSLLENVVGLDFLPRGEGVVTRRPLELRLVHCNEKDMKPYGVFDAMKEKKFENFDEVRDTINILTDKDAGTRKGIITDAIKLTIYSPDCPDLTIIDLPGITKIPLSNSDQPQNIEELTKNLAREYCKDDRTIILAVIPANQDVSTSEGLQMAKALDPTGERTIGVITKIDIMDKGTDARRLLMGHDVELKLGYVGVKNRSQLDINSKTRVIQSLKAEEDFFRSHQIYSTLPPELLGTRALIDKLSTVLFKHIRTYLPSIMQEIDNKVNECDDKLRRLGPALPNDQKERMQILYNMLLEYTENFKNVMRGKYDPSRSFDDEKKGEANEFTGGAKIKRMFNELYVEYCSPDYKITSCYKDDDIKKAITLHQGDSIPGFPSFDSFLYLIVPKINDLKEPALDTLNEIYIHMETLSQSILKNVFMRFPLIHGEISELSNKVLQDQRDKAKKVLENQLESELDYIFTNDNDYIATKANLEFKQNTKVTPEQVLVKELRTRVDSYFKIVVRNLRDTVPKTIGHFMVKVSQDLMQINLYNEVLKSQSIMSQLTEPAYVSSERETLTKSLNVLKKAQRIFKKDSDFALPHSERALR